MREECILLQKLTGTELETKIEEILKSPEYRWRFDDQDTLTMTAYLDRNDCIEDYNIKEIFKRANKDVFLMSEAYEDVAYEWYYDVIGGEYDDLAEEVCNTLDKDGYIDENDLEYDDDEDDEIKSKIPFNPTEVLEIVRDIVCVNPPTQELADRCEVPTTVSLKPAHNAFNDDNEIIDETIKKSEDGEEYEEYKWSIDKNCAVAWLIKQQGYTVDQFNKMLTEFANDDSKTRISKYVDGEGFKYSDSIFLNTLLLEYEECGWNYKDLFTFLICPSLSELFDIWDNKKEIRISKNAECGFYDSIQGAGGLFIQLEKDVVIPANMIDYDYVCPDCTNHYSVQEIFGLTFEAWQNGNI